MSENQQTQEEMKQVRVDIDSMAEEASINFFTMLQAFMKIAENNDIGKKGLIRAIRHSFNDNLTTHKVTLRSQKEKWLSDALKEMIKCYIIMYSKLMKDKETNNSQTGEGESNGMA